MAKPTASATAQAPTSLPVTATNARAQQAEATVREGTRAALANQAALSSNVVKK